MEAHLTLTIDGVDYRVEPIVDDEDGVPSRKFLKTRGDCAVHVVKPDPAGRPACTCSDFKFRAKRHPEGRCKHGTAAIAFDLLPQRDP